GPARAAAGPPPPARGFEPAAPWWRARARGHRASWCAARAAAAGPRTRARARIPTPVPSAPASSAASPAHPGHGASGGDETRGVDGHPRRGFEVRPSVAAGSERVRADGERLRDGAGDRRVPGLASDRHGRDGRHRRGGPCEASKEEEPAVGHPFTLRPPEPWI